MPARESITRLGGLDYPAKVKIAKKEVSSLEDLFKVSSEQGYLRSDNILEALYEPHLDNANCGTEAIRGLKARTALKTAARFHFYDEPIGNCKVQLVL